MKINLKNSVLFFCIFLVMFCKSNEQVHAKEQKLLEDFCLKFLDKTLDLQVYTGWWVYGEGQHVFKEETSLEEWELEFPNENMKEIEELYLAVCEMEYFPMEFQITGYIKKQKKPTGKTLVVDSFKILYIQGCGE